MFQKLSFKMKFYFILGILAIVSIFVLTSVFNLFNCNVRKDYKGVNDIFIQQIRDKITKIEKENIKEPTAIQRLAEQYNLLGVIYLEKHLWDLSIDAFTNSMKYGNSSPSVFYSLGLGYANRGNDKNSRDDLEKAENYYRKAIEIDKNHIDAKYALSILLFYHMNGRDEAQVLLNDVIARNKAYYRARFALARFNYELGNKEKALAVYKELSSDLDRLPPSDISNEYRQQCSDNITTIQMELSGR